MKKIISCCLVLTAIAGCADIPYEQSQDLSSAVSADLTLKERQASEMSLGELVDVTLNLTHEGVLAAGAMVVNLACDKVYSATTNNDWTMNNVSVTSGGTVRVISRKACRITLLSYNDGTNTYTPSSSSLVMSLSVNEMISPASAVQYTSGGTSPILQWFAASPAGLSGATINYAANAVSANTSPTLVNLLGQAVSLTVGVVSLGRERIASPNVVSLNLYSIPAINSGSASYTLTATVNGYTTCNYIDNSSGTYTATSWSSVNTAFNAAGAQACPAFVDGATGFTIGNWTSRWVTGVKTLIMWAHTVNGLNSYATANIGP